MKTLRSVAVAAATMALGAGLALAPSAHAATDKTPTHAAPESFTAHALPAGVTSQQCWNNEIKTTTARLAYTECRRVYNGRTQSSIGMRVLALRPLCAYGTGRIGDSPSTAGTRVKVRRCIPGAWSDWKISGWWNGNDAYEYLSAY
ncbi:hypothetical protein [Streptomyces sp. NRRL S-337]|uniref:hypothetical protein n=1 Tax=Streptomyces sp. NRRL S-337 TaxID=1463900 RepID=UPI0004CA56FB|nr:hypothetical protein [Streptomyces sp. NRRL S-337]